MNQPLIGLLTTGLAALLSASEPNKLVRPAVQPVVVLELFTSQGCSSCPPADRALQDITQQAYRADQVVYGLSFHVDYWNRLGWRDPFSAKQYTDRQRQYDQNLHTQTYTPQLIINGRQDVVGGQRGRIDQAIRSIQKQSASAFVNVDATLIRDPKQVTVKYTLSATGPYRVNVALVQREARTAVQSGENGGQTLVNTNVIRQFKTVDNSALSGHVILPLPTGVSIDETAVLVYIQRKDNGQIVGAKQVLYYQYYL